MMQSHSRSPFIIGWSGPCLLEKNEICWTVLLDDDNADDDSDDIKDFGDLGNDELDIEYGSDRFETLHFEGLGDVENEEVSYKDESVPHVNMAVVASADVAQAEAGPSREILEIPAIRNIRRTLTSSSVGSRSPTVSSVGNQPAESDFEEFSAFQQFLGGLSRRSSEPPIAVRTLHLKYACLAADRGGVSDRVAASIISGAYKNANVDIIVDRNKVRREREKRRFESLKSLRNNKLLKFLSFDGKRLNTMKTTDLPS